MHCHLKEMTGFSEFEHWWEYMGKCKIAQQNILHRPSVYRRYIQEHFSDLLLPLLKYGYKNNAVKMKIKKRLGPWLNEISTD